MGEDFILILTGGTLIVIMIVVGVLILGLSDRDAVNDDEDEQI